MGLYIYHMNSLFLLRFASNTLKYSRWLHFVSENYFHFLCKPVDGKSIRDLTFCQETFATFIHKIQSTGTFDSHYQSEGRRKSHDAKIWYFVNQVCQSWFSLPGPRQQTRCPCVQLTKDIPDVYILLTHISESKLTVVLFFEYVVALKRAVYGLVWICLVWVAQKRAVFALLTIVAATVTVVDNCDSTTFWSRRRWGFRATNVDSDIYSAIIEGCTTEHSLRCCCDGVLAARSCGNDVVVYICRDDVATSTGLFRANTVPLHTVAQTRRFTGIWTGFAEIIRVPRDKISDMWCWSSIEFTEWVEEVAIVRNTIARSSLQATVTRRGIKVLQGCVYRLHPFRTAAPLYVQSTLRRRLVCCPCLCFLILNV